MSYATYADKTLTCRDCAKEFNFTAAEQESFVQRGFNNDPSRCNECRAARKSQRGDSGESDRGYSERGGSREGGNFRDGGYRDGGYARAPRQMFSAICSECGQTAQVPFQPREDKPVYCSSCFETRRSPR